MDDRQSANPGRVKFTLDDGTVMFGTIERADSPTVAGTPLNKNTLFNSDNSHRFGANIPSEAFSLATKNWGVFPVLSSGWSLLVDGNGYYTNQVAVPGMLAVYEPFVELSPTNAEMVGDEESAFGFVKEIETFDGYIICKAVRIPKVTFNIRIMGV